MRTRKRILLITLLLFAAALVFAEELNFKLTHYVGAPNSNGYFEFWRPGTREKMTSVTWTGAGTYNQFSTLGVRYLGTFNISSLTITFSDLRQFTMVDGQAQFSQGYCPYQLLIYDSKNPDTLLVEPSSYTNQTGHGGATVSVFTAGKRWTSTSSTVREADSVALFSITIDDSEAPAGSFQGTITVEVGGS